jgi:hypothetical protein
MAAQRPASDSAEVTPIPAESGEVAPAAVAADPTPAAPDSVAPAPIQQVVYVEAPKPFVAKGNRGFGILIALLSTVVFAALYAVAEIVTELVNASPVDLGFITTLDFYAPVLMFAIGLIIVVLIVNRAGWAAHVLGSILVGLVVFFGGTGVILLLHMNQIPSNEVGATFQRVLFSVGAVVGGLLAREVALWMGFAIAARGRRVKARNVEARALYDQEIAAKRAEYEQANARTAATAAAVQPAEPSVAVEPAVEIVAP